ncbi:hypothetical protein V8C86DRAFT_2634149 [Haematococcus lacustris]
MAYNLYQVQMAKAWVERIDKENAVAEKFWTQQATHNAHAPGASYTHRHHEPSVAGSHTTSAAPTGYTSKTSFLKTRLEKLEAELDMEREQRKRVETDLAMIKTGIQASKPGSPFGH